VADLKQIVREDQPRALKGVKRCSMEVLEHTLKKLPPRLEYIDELETWLLDKRGNRKRRICGNHRKRGLPSVVPTGVSNPHGVINPYDAYRCTKAAGWGFDHLPGLGPCCYHAQPLLRNPERAQEYIRQRLLAREREGLILGTNSLEDQMHQAMAAMTVEELLDGTRLLWRIEALRQMAEGDMEDEGFDLDRATVIGNMLERMVNMRLKMAKTDNEIIKTQAIASVLECVLNGMVGIIEEQLGPGESARVLREFKERLVIPMNEQGFSEILKRQEAAGISGRVEISPTDFRLEA
jgi:hypothetical protein